MQRGHTPHLWLPFLVVLGNVILSCRFRKKQLCRKQTFWCITVPSTTNKISREHFLNTLHQPHVLNRVLCRYSVHRFPVDRSSCLHGFAGYFDCKLYADVHISIHPKTFSTGMFSWFPLFIPIRTPMYVSLCSLLNMDRVEDMW